MLKYLTKKVEAQEAKEASPPTYRLCMMKPITFHKDRVFRETKGVHF